MKHARTKSDCQHWRRTLSANDSTTGEKALQGITTAQIHSQAICKMKTGEAEVERLRLFRSPVRALACANLPNLIMSSPILERRSTWGGISNEGRGMPRPPIG